MLSPHETLKYCMLKFHYRFMEFGKLSARPSGPWLNLNQHRFLIDILLTNVDYGSNFY